METNRKLIGFFACGKRWGKTTAANKMKEELEAKGHKVIILSFAGVLREVCTDILGAFGVSPALAARLLTDDKDTREMGLSPYLGVSPEKLVSPRTGFLEPVGQTVRERIDPDAWVKALERRIDLLPDEIDTVIIDDVRKVNEAYFIRSNAGELVFIERKDLWDTHDRNHSDAVEAKKIMRVFNFSVWRS